MEDIAAIQERLKERSKEITALQVLQEADRKLLKSLGEEVRDNQKQEKIKKARKKIEKAKEINVTDHALLRYLERVQKIDVEQLRKELVTDKVRDLVAVLGGTGRFPRGDCALVLKGYGVVTVLTESMCKNFKQQPVHQLKRAESY